MLAIGRTSKGGGYTHRYTKWSEDVSTSGLRPDSLSVYENQEEALQDIAETSAYLRDNPSAQDAADRLDFLATLSNAVFLMRKEYPDQWEEMERSLRDLSLELDSESFERLSAELDNLTL